MELRNTLNESYVSNQMISDNIEMKKLLDWYNKIKKVNAKVKKVKIIANDLNINNIIGHKKENIEKLKETYDVDVVIERDEKIKPGKFKLEILELYQ